MKVVFISSIEWRKAAQAGAAPSLALATRERRGHEREVKRLRTRAERAEAELVRHKAALDLMGKAHALLETLSESAEPQPRSKRCWGAVRSRCCAGTATAPDATERTQRRRTQRVFGVLTEPRFADKAVARTWAVLLDEGSSTFRVMRWVFTPRFGRRCRAWSWIGSWRGSGAPSRCV